MPINLMVNGIIFTLAMRELIILDKHEDMSISHKRIKLKKSDFQLYMITLLITIDLLLVKNLSTLLLMVIYQKFNYLLASMLL